MAGINGARFPVRGATPDVMVVACSATGTNGADCTITEGTGITSIARSDEGEYTVTFNNYGNKLLFACGTVETAVDAIGRDCEIKTVTLAGTGTALIETWTRATDAVAAAKGDVVVDEVLRLLFVFGQQD